jgi:hypothetical protein
MASVTGEWIKHAWDHIQTDLVIKTVKCGISNTSDGCEDDLVWDSDGEKNNSYDSEAY